MAQLLPVDDFDLIIFGGAGDLSMRKLLPALWNRHCDGQFTDASRIIAVGRRPMSRDDYCGLVESAIGDRSSPAATLQWESFRKRLEYVDLDATDAGTWGSLAGLLEGARNGIRAVYLATPPDLYGSIAEGFQTSGLLSADTRIVLEKPVGHDFASAREINDRVGAVFPERQVFRIDHYLGKETVQNLLALRFGNSILEPLWRREVIDHVQITVAEALGVGNRVDFYDGTGALKDMVQNHLLQLVCLVAMEPPADFEDDAVRNEKIKVLRALAPITEASAELDSVRGQYVGGTVGGEAVDGYLEELGAESDTETFVALKVAVDNWRWSGVPFYLRTGKRMPEKHSEIVIQFKPVPHAIFDEVNHPTQPNRLTIQLQPDEGVKLHMMAKEPGPGQFGLRPVSLDLSFEETFGMRYPDAYERLVIEVFRGNQALFMRRDEIEAAWRWIDRISSSWQATGQKPEDYVAGSWGPSGASRLLARAERAWHGDP